MVTGQSRFEELPDDVLRGLLGVKAEDPPLAVRDVLRKQVATLCPDCFDDVFPHLARLLSLPLDDEVEAALLDLGRYAAAWQSLQQEIADEHCQLGRALKEFGEGMRFLELMAYGKARSVFESVIGQAKQLGRAWLLPWAEAGLAKSLVQSQRLDELNLDWINQDLARTSTTLPAAAPQLLGEIALQERKLDEALRQAEKAGTEAEARGWKPSYVTALELQLRVLLLLDRPEDVISLAGEGIRMAEEMEYRPLLWRVRLAKAQALAALRAREAAAQEYKASAAVIRALASTIDDAQLKRGFMSNTSVSMVLERG